MTKIKVEQMITNYREHNARCEHLKNCIVELEQVIKRMSESLVEDGLVLSANLSGMPHGQQGMSDPTGALGDRVADGYKSEHIKQAEKEIKTLRDEYDQKHITVLFVNAWIKVLNTKEKFVIEQKYFEGMSWRQLSYSFYREFNDMYTSEGLRRLKNTAMSKIFNIAR